MIRRPLAEAPQPAPEGELREAATGLPAPAPPETPPEVPSENQASEGQISETSPAKSPPEKSSPTALEVWWPKDTGPFRRQQRQRRHKEEAGQKIAAASPRNPEYRQPTKRQPGQKRPPAPAANPDSPFAVLGSLRSQLVDKKNA
jgi:ATP-dependent RNA helicase SUPV3L1/SUV3